MNKLPKPLALAISVALSTAATFVYAKPNGGEITMGSFAMGLNLKAEHAVYAFLGSTSEKPKVTVGAEGE